MHPEISTSGDPVRVICRDDICSIPVGVCSAVFVWVVVWYGVVWCGVVWCGVVWYAYGMVV